MYVYVHACTIYMCICICKSLLVEVIIKLISHPQPSTNSFHFLFTFRSTGWHIERYTHTQMCNKYTYIHICTNLVCVYTSCMLYHNWYTSTYTLYLFCTFQNSKIGTVQLMASLRFCIIYLYIYICIYRWVYIYWMYWAEGNLINAM